MYPRQLLPVGSRLSLLTRGLRLAVSDTENCYTDDRPVGRDLLALYLRYHDFGGRHSVVVTVDGKSVQVESGPVLAFFAKAIEPLNRFLVEELHRRPLSTARVLRAGLRARRYPS
jgi:hypothetical protein